MKFAMVAINSKYDEENKLHVRRVLISYLFKTSTKSRKNFKTITYHGTKFISADDYFYKDNSSHKYEFKDKYYKLLDVTNEYNKLRYSLKKDIYKKRKYHYTNIVGIKPIEFKCKLRSEAVMRFYSRKELK